MGISWLIGAAAVTLLLWQFSWGNYILYPFSILATWFHEMGHGLTALFLGGNFHKLVMLPNGSGYAVHSGSLFLGPIGRALVAAGDRWGQPWRGGYLLFLVVATKMLIFV
jgi:hypothetical protein